MKKLMFALAGAALTSFAAETGLVLRTGDIDATGFEGFAAEAGVAEKNDNGTTGGTVLWYSSGTDESLVKAYGGEGNLANNYGGTFPDLFNGAGSNYLALDTSGNVLTRYFQQPTVDSSGETPVITPDPVTIDTTVYIDTMVQFTPSETEPTSEELAGAKLAIWLGITNVNDVATTNLYVKAGVVAGDGSVDASTLKLNAQVEPGTWYRLTVTALKNVTAKPASKWSTEGDGEGFLNGFQIYLNGNSSPLTTDTVLFNESYITGTIQDQEYGWPVDADTLTLLRSRSLFPALGSGSDMTATISQVDFKGSGAIDDFLVTTVLPGFLTPAVDFTLTWPAGLTAVSYTVGSDAAESLSGETSPKVIQVAPGSTVALTVADVNGVEKTITATQGSEVNGINATGTTFTWADYLGDAVNGAYEIDNLAELVNFQKGVATNAASANASYLATAGLTFKLTADVALTDTWPGIGIAEGKDMVHPTDGTAETRALFNGAAFCGTFDGQGHQISGFQMVAGCDYGGFFNSIYGATIRNLTIACKPGENDGPSLFTPSSSSSSADCGGLFVGVARASTLQYLATAAGTLNSGKGIGGIVGYLMAGSTVEYCTNNLAISSLKPNKAAGIAMTVQGDEGNALVLNCVNNGMMSGSGESGALLGYVSQNTILSNCESTVAFKLLHHASSTVTVYETIKGSASVVAYSGNATPGLQFATVSGDVATFVTDGVLAAGNTYKVLGPSATATYEFASAGSISFDTNLIQSVTFAITAPGLDLTEATESGVVTYTAASSGSTVHPGENDGETYASQAAAEAAAAGVTIEASDAVSTALGADTATYEGRFEAQAVEVSAGVWNVVVGLKAAEEATLQTQANDDAGDIVGALGAATVTVDTTPGFYYSVKYGSALDAMNYQTAGELATGNTKSITLPAKSGTAGFYKVVISITPSEAVAPQN